MNRQRKQPLVQVVDDDLTSQISMRAALEQAGFAVAVSADGRAAIADFIEQQPDLVLLDVMMPGMDGFATCRVLRGLPGGEHKPILIVTGLDDVAAIHRAFECGATDFITKPINRIMLGYRVRYMLRANQTLFELHRSQLQLAKAQQLARLGNWELDPARRIITGSAEFFRLLGLSGAASELSYRALLKIVPPEDRRQVRSAIDRAFAEQKGFSLQHRILLPNGEERIFVNQAEAVDLEDGTGAIVQGIVQDVTRLRQAEEKIRYLAFYDGLTGLANRQLLADRLQKALAINQRGGRVLALLFLDLDRFKRINDTLGHRTGDQLLKQVAERIETCIRVADSVGRVGRNEEATCVSRLGGDEFLILLSELASPEDAAKVAERLIQAISRPLQLDGHEVFVTTSIGISIFPHDGRDSETLVKNADSAMYDAKARGRNGYQFYRETLNTAAERLELENDLRRALQRNEFELYYQPQYTTGDSRLIGAEALIRWQHPQKGMVSPGEFIAIAEDSGLIFPLSEWVAHNACRQNKAWQQQGLKPIRVAINLSAQQFSLAASRQKMAEMLRAALATSRLDARYLEIELTEGMLMENTEDTSRVLRQLKDMGIGIAIDDFGTGYSSLAYLKAFPIDTLKIDRSFIQDIVTSPDSAAITRTIVAMAHHLGLDVVAEGVETAAQLTFLEQIGCQKFQGFLRSRPLPAEAFTELLQRESLEADLRYQLSADAATRR